MGVWQGIPWGGEKARPQGPPCCQVLRTGLFPFGRAFTRSCPISLAGFFQHRPLGEGNYRGEIDHYSWLTNFYEGISRLSTVT